ncbi:MAG: cell division protein FtsA [Candidatus Methylacidiphilales bacterium]
MIVALEVGSAHVRVAVAELREDQSMLLRGVGECASSGVRKGEVFDVLNAQQDIKAALHEAENNLGVEIDEVYLSLSGSHIKSKQVKVKVQTDPEDMLVTGREITELDEMAGDQPLPDSHAILHVLLQHYTMDERVRSPEALGHSAASVEAEYLIIHGLRNRLETMVRAIMELEIEVKGVVFAPYAAAQIVLSKEVKKQGAVVIDLGAGTTDYVVYVDGAVEYAGSLGLGGDHLTSDLSIGLKYPYAATEELKCRHGRLYPDSRDPHGVVEVARTPNCEERVFYKESIAKIMSARQWETLSLVKRDLDEQNIWDKVHGGVILTGGASRVPGLEMMAAEIFPAPCKLSKDFLLDGDQTYSRRPDLATVLGLIRYAQTNQMQNPEPRGISRVREGFSRMIRSFGIL